jgi:hypothetical protein
MSRTASQERRFFSPIIQSFPSNSPPKSWLIEQERSQLSLNRKIEGGLPSESPLLLEFIHVHVYTVTLQSLSQ